MKFAAAPRFNFFTRAPVNDPDSGQPFRFEGVVIVAATSGRGLLTFGSEDGAIFQFDRQMQAVRNFQAYTDRLLACHQVRQQDVLVTVGHEEQEERVKVWSLGKTNQDGVPFCSGIFSVNPPIPQPRSTAAAFLIGMASFASAVPFSGTRSTAAPTEQEPAPSLEPPTSTYACVDVHEGLSHMVIGTEGGLVQLFRGDVTRERHKRQLLHQCPRAVTCVSLRLLDAGGGREGRRGQRVLVFVATEGNVMSILAEPGRLGDKHEPRKTILLQVGAPLGCSAPVETLGSVGERDALFAVAGDDAIRVFDATGESRCYGFEGSKVVVRFFKHYLLFVTREARPGKRRGEQGSEVHLLTLYDLAQCIIAYSAPLSSEVRQVVTSGWGGVFVVCADRSVHCLTEADVQSKLHMLFTKKNYDLAVRIAKAHNFDAEGLADIFRRHGDYLYKKGDMDGAMKEYIKTIGNLEASYVIRRYLDASRIHNLTAYLRELHARHLETEDHTTLLLNCYTKLHDEDSLNLFITSDDTRVAMNAEAAIRVLCQAGYYALALVLAKKFSVHSWFLRIQVEHMGQFEEALRYIAALDTSLASRYAEEYGKLLMSKLPVKTTDLLLQLCSREAKANGRLDAERLEEYRTVFVNNRAGWVTFLEGFARLDPSDGAAVRRQLLELYLEEYEAGRGAREELEKKILELLEEASPYDQQALVQCHLHGFEAGYLKLCLRLGHLDQLMQHHVTADEPQEVLALCEQHGASNPDLWVQAVEYFAARERQNGGGAEIQRVLDRLRERNIMSPLMVVRLLATSSASCSLSAVKAYVLDQLEKEDRKIEADEDLIRRYKREIESAKQEIGQLEQSVKIFQNQKCSLCRTDLDLPAVFFFCDHSFHQVSQD